MYHDNRPTDRHIDRLADGKSIKTESFLDENGNILFDRQSTSSTIKLTRSFLTTLKLDTESKAPGNKFVESIVSQINQRSDITSKMPLSPNYYKLIWVNIAETVMRSSPFYPAEYDEAKWVESWETIRRYGSCDVEYFNYLSKLGIAHCIGKNILVFDGRKEAGEDGCVYVMSPSDLGGTTDSTPVVLSFDGSSYRGLLPTSKTDVAKIQFIVELLVKGVSDVVTIRQMICEKFETSHVFEYITKSRHSLSRKSLKRLNPPRMKPLFSGKNVADSILNLPSKLCSIGSQPKIKEENEENYENCTNPPKAEVSSTTKVSNIKPTTNPSLIFHPLMREGIELGKQYFINLKPGTPNGGCGNCSIESVMDQINSRECFPEKLPFTRQFYREIWMRETERITRNSAYFLDDFTEEQWKGAWTRLRQDGEYEIDYFGDLMIVGIMHCVKKNALVFNTSSSRSHGPLTVIRGDHFGVEIGEEDPPLVLAYSGSHYESLLPVSQLDVEKTVYIVKHWSNFDGADMRSHLLTLDWFKSEVGGTECPTEQTEQRQTDEAEQAEQTEQTENSGQTEQTKQTGRVGS